MSYIYVVIGETGEYSDMTYEVVAAFFDEEDAKKFCEQEDGKRRLYDQWSERAWGLQRQLNIGHPDPFLIFNNDALRDMEMAKFDARRQQAQDLAGPEPEYVRERHHYEKVHLVTTPQDTQKPAPG